MNILREWYDRHISDPQVVILGVLLAVGFAVMFTFGQMLAPVSAGTVASLMMGVAWGTGGLAVPIVGLAADHIGIEAALTWLAVVPVVAALCAWPNDEVKSRV